MKYSFLHRLSLLFVIIYLNMGLTACDQVNQLVQPWLKPASELLPTKENLITPSPVIIAGQPTATEAGEVYYTNVRYGFSFRYSPTWALQEGPNILKLTRGNLVFVIGYKMASERTSLANMSPGAGEFNKGDSASFLGQDIEKTRLVYQEKVKAVFYKGHDAEIQANPTIAQSGLVFTLSLYDINSSYQNINIQPSSQAEIDQIVASFEYDPAQAQSSAGLGIHAEAHDTFIYFTTCFDLDEGRRMEESSVGCDFSVYSGGDNIQVEFTPIFPASFAFTDLYASQPDVDQCQKIDGMVSDPVTLIPQSKFLCYKTKTGRFGYMHIKQIDSSGGITFDWQTYEAQKLNTEPLIRKDSAEFVKDVTFSDGTEVKGGEKFIKTWRLRNNGETTWTTGYSLVFDRGDPMGNTFTIPIPQNVQPGETVDVSIELTAPHHRGDYSGWWMLRNKEGIRFGTGKIGDQPFYVMIKVTRSVVQTPTPSVNLATPTVSQP